MNEAFRIMLTKLLRIPAMVAEINAEKDRVFTIFLHVKMQEESQITALKKAMQ